MNLLFKSMTLTRLAIGLVIAGLTLVPVNASDQGASPSHIVSSMPANSWLEIPNSQLDSVAANAGKYPELQGYMGIDGITAYSGGVYDSRRNRLVVWGGGHGDYLGNEIYAFDINTLAWERLTDPSTPNLDEQVNSDGTPNSRHTYNGLAYIEHADRFFASGGSLAGAGSCGADKTWIFDFDAKKWTDMKPGVRPKTDCENVSAYDPESKKVWWFDLSGLWSYNYDKNKWKQRNDVFLSSRTAVVDTKRGLLVVVGQGEVVSYNLRNKDYRERAWKTIGGESLVNEMSPGLAYDPVSDRIVGWAGDAVYSLNSDTKKWTQHEALGGPNAESLNSVYGLWRYVPSLNAFIVMPGVKKNVYFYKLTDGGG